MDILSIVVDYYRFCHHDKVVFERGHYTPESIMEHMIKAKRTWTETEKVIAAIAKKLRQEEVSSKNEGERNINVNAIQPRDVIPNGIPAGSVQGEGGGFSE